MIKWVYIDLAGHEQEFSPHKTKRSRWIKLNELDELDELDKLSDYRDGFIYEMRKPLKLPRESDRLRLPDGHVLVRSYPESAEEQLRAVLVLNQPCTLVFRLVLETDFRTIIKSEVFNHLRNTGKVVKKRAGRKPGKPSKKIGNEEYYYSIAENYVKWAENIHVPELRANYFSIGVIGGDAMVDFCEYLRDEEIQKGLLDTVANKRHIRKEIGECEKLRSRMKKVTDRAKKLRKKR